MSWKSVLVNGNSVKKITLDGKTLFEKQTIPYITNGLVLYLDGINNTRAGHNESSRVWEDLSGNRNDFNLSSGVVINSKFMQKTSFSSSNIISQNNIPALSLNSMTIEVIYSLPSRPYSYNRLIDVNSSLTIFQTSSAGYIRVWTPYGEFNSGPTINGNTMYSMVATYNNNLLCKQYHNNVLYQNKTLSSNLTQSGAMGIGSTSDGSGEHLACNIYAVRIYNRVLTNEEMTQNYNTDIERFTTQERYIDIEYIESHGNEYIITDFKGDYRYTTETKFQFTANENDKAIFGSGNGSGGLEYHMTWYQQRWYMNCAYGYECNKDFGVPCTDLTEVSFNTSDRKVVLNDISFTPSSSNLITNTNISLFSRNIRYSPSNMSKARMYYFNIYNYSTGEYVAKLKPVRKESNGEVGMYDTINRKFYGNNGSGAFTGPDVN